MSIVFMVKMYDASLERDILHVNDEEIGEKKKKNEDYLLFYHYHSLQTHTVSAMLFNNIWIRTLQKKGVNVYSYDACILMWCIAHVVKPVLRFACKRSVVHLIIHSTCLHTKIDNMKIIEGKKRREWIKKNFRLI